MAQVKSFRELIGIKPSTASVTDSVLLSLSTPRMSLLTTVDVASTRKAIAGLLKKYRQARGDIVHVVHITPPGAPIFTPGTDLAKEFVELEPVKGEKVVEKQYPSSFAGTDLDAHLKKPGKSKIVLTGYMAHACVSTTARAGAELGYEVVLARDAIGAKDIPGAKAETVVEVVLAAMLLE